MDKSVKAQGKATPLRVERTGVCQELTSLPLDGSGGNGVLVCGAPAVPFASVSHYIDNAEHKDGRMPAHITLRMMGSDNEWKDIEIDPRKMKQIQAGLTKAGVSDGSDIAIGTVKDVKVFLQEQRIVVPGSMLEQPVGEIVTTLIKQSTEMQSNKPLNLKRLI